MQNGRQLQGNVARRSQLRWALLNAGHSPCSPPSGPTCRAQHPEREIMLIKIRLARPRFLFSSALKESFILALSEGGPEACQHLQQRSQQTQRAGPQLTAS